MADTDLLTLDEASTMLGVAGDADLTLLQTYIATASKAIDDRCGPVVVRPMTETHDGGSASIWLSAPPIDAISDVHEWDGATDTGCSEELPFAFPVPYIPEHGYKVDMLSGRLDRRRNGTAARWAAGAGNVLVLYTAGRYATTADVDGRFKQAAFMIVRQLWTREQASGTVTYGTPDVWVPTYAVPNAVDEILAGELRPPAVA